MPRFVLLYHDCPPNDTRSSHWDFMLEAGDVLRTWALEQLPSSWHVAHHATRQADATCPTLSAADTVAAEQLGDHRREYLEFEGEISGNRGRITRIAAGTYAVEIEQNRRGLAHFAESAEQNVPVPLSADDFGIGPYVKISLQPAMISTTPST
jgi:hypothetical protein